MPAARHCGRRPLPRGWTGICPGWARQPCPNRPTNSINPLPGPLKLWVDQGALFYYGVNYPALGEAAAQYVDKILKGAKPADLPVEYPRRFELILNLKTAKALGLTISQSLLLRADEVI